MKIEDLIRAKRVHIDRLANAGGAAGERALAEMEGWLPKPRGAAMKLLLKALRDTGVAIKASAFDAIYLPAHLTVDFSDEASVAAALPAMTFLEVKTAKQERVKPDFSGFFFAMTESEIDAAAVLGERHRVALFNKLTGAILITSVPELFARSRSRTIQVSVQL